MSDRFIFEGHLLCLDLVNTRLIRRGAPIDLLVDFDALMDWLEEAGAVSPRLGRSTRHTWAGKREAKNAVRVALELRRTIREAADRLMAGRPVATATLDAINALLAAQPTVTEVKRAAATYECVARRLDQGPVSLLAPVLESTVELLTSLDATRLHKCEGENCVLYYYDTSKNRSRRWCSMERCGNRAKAAAHYRRRRGAE